MALSNDPLLIEGVVTQPYTDTVAWTFDDRRVIWVQTTDSIGNRSEPYPAYAALTNEVVPPTDCPHIWNCCSLARVTGQSHDSCGTMGDDVLYV